jgi:ubiquinone/menaquinone biosynthesis C-methylase UbiE
MSNEQTQRICPLELAGSLDNSFRRFFQNPERILKPYIKNGMTVLDLGCGPGFFTLEIAKMLMQSGKVIAADLQEGMLEKIRHKIKGTNLEEKVELHKCEDNKIGLAEKVDFIFAFWMIHEVPDHNRLFEELKSILNQNGKIFIIEPKFHVSHKSFEEMSNRIVSLGFEITERPKVFFSRSLIVSKSK